MSSTINDIKQKIMGTSVPAGQHQAAILNAPGTPLEITHRQTPTPGPKEILIEAKAIAFNPVDYYMRAAGFAITSYPAVLGSDVAGTVVSVGSSVPSDAPQPGSRVAAFAPMFYMKDANYGAFQKQVLVPVENVTPLPQNISFQEAALLPMAVGTSWGGFYAIGIARDTAYTAADKKGMLVWGGASSIGTGAIQLARSMGFHTYVTASGKHHEYLKSLGASKVFDYKDEDVVSQIVKAAKADGVTLNLAYDAVSQLQFCLDVVKEFKVAGTAKIAESTPPKPDGPTEEGVEVIFMQPPKEDKARAEFSHYAFAVWLKEKLATGEYVPSPKIRLVEGGLESVNKALDEWKNGVSGEKVVLEI